MLHRAKALTVLIASLLPALAACGGRLYKVAPLPTSVPPEISMGNGGGLDVGAVALDGERSYERFEANLPLAGVIAVDVRMINKSEAAIMTNSLRFELRNPSGDALKQGDAIEPEREIRGIVFFQTKRETTSIDGMILSVAGLSAPVNVQLQTAHK